jgi:hypothetical protein
MEWREAKDYWEKRAIITENVLNVTMSMLGNALPHVLVEIDSAREAWNKAIDELENEFPDKGE